MIDKILNERAKQYGSFHGVAKISQGLKGIIHEYGQIDKMLPEEIEAVEMILHKVARLVNNPESNHNDTIDDICGYASLLREIRNNKDLQKSEINNKIEVEVNLFNEKVVRIIPREDRDNGLIFIVLNKNVPKDTLYYVTLNEEAGYITYRHYSENTKPLSQERLKRVVKEFKEKYNVDGVEIMRKISKTVKKEIWGSE